MLKGIIKHRPKQVLAIYAEPEQIQVIRAHRKWRKWETEPAEHYSLPEGETLFDHLQRLNLRPRSRQATALILFLPRSFYSFHREHYPMALQDRLEEALTFDWQENIFHEHEQTLHFFGPPVPVNQHLSVPIFSLQRDVYEKFHQALDAQEFEAFAVIPSALIYESFFAALASEEDHLPIEIMGRLIDSSHLEVHRFYQGLLLDSMVLGKDQDNLRLFRESLLCLTENECQSEVHIHLVCSNGECDDDYFDKWRDQELLLRPHFVNDSLVSHWLDHLLGQDDVQGFDSHVLLKPWSVPRVVWPLLFAVVVYSLFAFFQVHSLNNEREAYRAVKKENFRLETEWKPIEQLQTRISKFMEDQKTLSEFNVEGYPLLEILTVLSQATPNDTWLNYLSVRKGQLLIRGESKSAIKYLPELSKIDGFTDVRFASPVTKNPASDQERFNVQIQLDLAKFKKTIESMPSEEGAEGPNVDASPNHEPGPRPALAAPQPVRAPASAVSSDKGTETDEEASSDEEPGDEAPSGEQPVQADQGGE